MVVEVKSHKKIQVKNGDFYYGFNNKLEKIHSNNPMTICGL